MKKCPKCGTRNQITNMFCPTCGYSFIDEPEKQKPEPPPDAGKNRRKYTIVAVVVIVALGLTAGLVSFLVSREIEQGRLVTVETGVIWKCSECGKIYRKRVVTVEVPKSERDDYTVETVEGKCYLCEHGPEVALIDEVLRSLSGRVGSEGGEVEMDPAAALFIAENPGLFPARDSSQVEGIAMKEDPRRVLRDFEEFAGKPIHVRGNIVASEILTADDGTKMTYLQLVPVEDGRELEVEYFIVYPGISDLLKGDVADCYLLPVDQVRYGSGGENVDAVLTVGIFLSGGLP